SQPMTFLRPVGLASLFARQPTRIRMDCERSSIMDMIRVKAADIAEQAATLLQELAQLLRSDRSETSQRVESAPPVEVARPAETTRPVDVARQAEYPHPVEITRPVDVTPKDKVAAMFPPVSRRQKEEVARRLKVFWEGVSLEPNLDR